MKVVEQFISINGEGTRAGELAVFIRFKGCNLNCGYCDTKWANLPNCEYREQTPEELYEYIKETKVKNVILTGGEPLLQKDMGALLELLSKDGQIRVEIETNGSVELKRFSSNEVDAKIAFSMDYKLPSSGCEASMKQSNFALLQMSDTVKFVVGTRVDLERAAEVIEEFSLTKRCKVYISPVFGSIEPVEIVEFMMDKKMNDMRFQIQLHKVIWDPDKRGV